MLNDVMLNDVMLNVIMLNVVAPIFDMIVPAQVTPDWKNLTSNSDAWINPKKEKSFMRLVPAFRGEKTWRRGRRCRKSLWPEGRGLASGGRAICRQNGSSTRRPFCLPELKQDQIKLGQSTSYVFHLTFFQLSKKEGRRYSKKKWIFRRNNENIMVVPCCLKMNK